MVSAHYTILSMRTLESVGNSTQRIALREYVLSHPSLLHAQRCAQCTQWNSIVNCIALLQLLGTVLFQFAVIGDTIFGGAVDPLDQATAAVSPATHCWTHSHSPTAETTDQLTTHHSAALRAGGARSCARGRRRLLHRRTGPQRGAVRGVACGERHVRLLREQLQRLRVVTRDAI